MSATHSLDVDEIQSTRGEKALAVVLAIFLFVGLVWGYTKLDTREGYRELPALTPAEQAAVDAHDRAEAELAGAESAHQQALTRLELDRERYRTALDADEPAAALKLRYEQAERDLADAERRLAAARAEAARTQPAAEAAEKRRSEALEAERRHDERVTFIWRLVFVLSLLGAAYGWMYVLRGSRYFALGIAGVGAAVLLTLVFAADYVEDQVEWRDTGPAVISVAGIGLTVLSFWGLQRYLQRRIPLRRVKKGECPFCGFPAAGNKSCEGCGRTVTGSCGHCGEQRRVGVQFCGACGKA